ncbi:MAG TPA: hypothetical protein VKG84_03530, partial [Candidatus Acidoferrales bacterium]|nr:hypothetical protein [Candidatus Acidoferrales bacterium]
MNELSLRDLRGSGLSTPFVVTVVLAAAAILWVAPKAAQGDYRDLLVAFIILQSLWIVLFWRMGVYFFMFYVVVEGFLINYFDGLSALNLAKDVFVALLFLSIAVVLILKRRAPFPRLGWVLPFAGFALYYCAEVFNPNLPTILVGLVGIRVTLFYCLLTPVAYWFFDSSERVVHFFLFMVALSIPVAAFGIVQYFKGPEWMIGISPGFARAVFYAYWRDSLSGPGAFRTFSTFVHTGAFSQYLALMMLVTGALWGLYRQQLQRLVIGVVLLVQFFALLTTGGRASFLIFFICVVLWWFFQRGTMRLAPVLVLLPVFFYAATLMLGSSFENRFSTLLDADQMKERNAPLVMGFASENVKEDLTGLGAGYATVAARHVGETPYNVATTDNGLAKIRHETGIPGLILY